MIDISCININLLYAFHAIMVEKNISKAAEKCFRSQPAISLQLNQLRKIFNDDLFVRTSDGMQPTAFSLKIYPAVFNILESTERLFSAKSKFIPDAFEGKITIGLTQYSEQVCQDIIFCIINKVLPNCRGIDVIRPRVFDDETFEKYHIDIGICSPRKNYKLIKSALLFEDNYIVMGKKGFFPRGHTLSIEEYLTFNHVSISYDAEKQTILDQVLFENNMVRQKKITTSSLYGALNVVKATDCIVTLAQKNILDLLNTDDYDIYPFPFEFKIPICMVWHKRNDTDQVNQLLRDAMMVHDWDQAITGIDSKFII